MPHLTILYDPVDLPLVVAQSDAGRLKYVTLSLGNGLTNVDIYETAKKLAELLLEQMTREEGG